MIAFTAIPGVCGLVTSEPLRLKRRPLGRDVLAYALALALLYALISDGEIVAGESVGMVLLYGCYMAIVVSSSSIRQLYRTRWLGRAPREKSSFVTQAREALNPEGADSAAPVRDVGAPYAPAAAAGGGGEAGAATPQRGHPTPAVTPSVTPIIAVTATRLPAGAATPALDAVPLPRGHLEVSTSMAQLDVTAPDARRHVAYALASRACGAALAPLRLALRVTCPECAHDSPTAHLYLVTFFASFLWVAFFSTAIAAVVTRWGELLGIPAAFLGMYIIALGAEIPDTIQSVTVAKRGYGSMAVSNSTGSQIINILLGLGVPWLMTNASGRAVRVTSVPTLLAMARFQFGAVVTYLSLLLLPTFRTWRPGDHSKAVLDRRKGAALLGAYLVILLSCAPVLLGMRGEPGYNL